MTAPNGGERYAPRNYVPAPKPRENVRSRRSQQHQTGAVASDRLVGGVAGTRRWHDYTDAATITLEFKRTNKHRIANMAGNRTIVFEGSQGAQIVVVAIQQDATGSRVPSFPSGVSWDGGGSTNTQPTTSAAATEWSLWAFIEREPNQWFGGLIWDELKDAP